MGVIKTGDIYKGFTFDGVDSKQYGTYITGEAVYNAPERDVEMIDIPGRNGSFVLDKGRFNNIIVTYPAGMFGGTQTDFADGISALRNALASRKGYCRLTDDYNPNEYRMAVYKSGMELTPSAMSKGGQFDIVFDCKPQRFLTSGETAVTKANNSTISNPTLFPSSPLLQVTGYGTINLGSESVQVTQNILGEVIVGGNTYSTSPQPSMVVTIDNSNANSGDSIRTSASYSVGYTAKNDAPISVSVSNTGTGTADYTISKSSLNATITTGDMSFVYGTSKTVSNTAVYTVSTEQSATATLTVSFSVAYNGTTTFTLSSSATTQTPFTVGLNTQKKSIADIILDSTKQAGTIYIDCEIGEAYKLDNNVMTSANNIVVLPAELPTLKPGNTTITFPNTVTQLKITPRWWKV